MMSVIFKKIYNIFTFSMWLHAKIKSSNKNFKDADH